MGGPKRLFGVDGVQTFSGVAKIMRRCMNNYGRLIHKVDPETDAIEMGEVTSIKPFDLRRVPNRNNSALVFDIAAEVCFDKVIVNY